MYARSEGGSVGDVQLCDVGVSDSGGSSVAWVRTLVDEALERLEGEFAGMYSHTGRPSIAPEKLLSRVAASGLVPSEGRSAEAGSGLWLRRRGAAARHGDLEDRCGGSAVPEGDGGSRGSQ